MDLACSVEGSTDGRERADCPTRASRGWRSELIGCWNQTRCYTADLYAFRHLRIPKTVDRSSHSDAKGSRTRQESHGVSRDTHPGHADRAPRILGIPIRSVQAPRQLPCLFLSSCAPYRPNSWCDSWVFDSSAGTHARSNRQRRLRHVGRQSRNLDFHRYLAGGPSTPESRFAQAASETQPR